MPPYDPYGFGNAFGTAPTSVPWTRTGGMQPRAQGITPYSPVNDPQLDWIAAINGQTVPEYLEAQASYQARGGAPAPTPFQTWLPQGGDVNQQIFNAQQTEQQALRDLDMYTDSYNRGLGVAYEGYGNLATGARQRADWLGTANQDLARRATDSAQWANAQDQASLGAYSGAVSNAGAWDMQNFGNLQAAANAPMQMQASAYVGDAMSDPADVARQVAVFNQLQGAANGSLDVTSQAAQAYANAEDVSRQRAAAMQLERAGQGALDVDLSKVRELNKLRDPDSIRGMKDLYGVFNGSQDVRVGQADPEAYKAAVATRDKLWDLTDPTVTAQEKLMFELQKQQQEQDEGAVRDALRTDAQRRGVGGQGTEIARSALAAQQTSRNRMLQDMQALAMAQARSMDALQGHGALSTNMTAQANQIALQNQATRVGALGQYTDVHANAANVLGQLGAANATNNANRQLQAQGMAYQAYAELRAQGFSEEYARGQAADMVAMSNSDRRLGAMNSSAALSTDMRNASDAMSRFNQSQRQQQSQFADSYAANRQDAAYGRQVDVFNAGNTVGRNYMTDQGNLFNAQTGVTGATHARNMGTVELQRGLNNDFMGQHAHADSVGATALAGQHGIMGQQFANNTNRINTRVQVGRQAVNDATTIRGNRIADEEIAYVRGQSPGGGAQPLRAASGAYVPTTTTHPLGDAWQFGTPWNGGTPI